MALKTHKPTTSSQRTLVLVDKSSLYKGKPVKALTKGKKEKAGHDAFGHTSSRYRGGGHKRKHRAIDFKRGKRDITATVVHLEYDPNRSAHIALLKYEDGELSYILAPQRLNAGDKVIAGESVDIKPGNALPLKNIPVGTIIHNVELKVGKGGQIARSAGAYVQLTGKDAGFAIIRLMSGEVRKVAVECYATIGATSNPDHQNQVYGKAGRMRWKGFRPHVRGVAMNPVDHPLGGGEGKTSGGRHPVSPWGKPAKGGRTRSAKKASNKAIVTSRHKRKK
jgi:large subunit ribosomal protein L2